MNDKTEPRDVPLLTASRALNWHDYYRGRGKLEIEDVEALEALMTHDAAVYKTHTHRVVPIEAEAVAWIIPGDDNARDGGWLDCRIDRDGEFTRPLYDAPPDQFYLIPPDHAALLEALKPLAALLQDHNDKGDDSRPVFAINGAELTLGDLRRAKAAIARSKA